MRGSQWHCSLNIDSTAVAQPVVAVNGSETLGTCDRAQMPNVLFKTYASIQHTGYPNEAEE